MKNIHFIAIGGAIMHQLAISLQKKGYNITGSDDEITDPAKSNLAHAGILPPVYGWFPERINTDLDAVVLGMHAKENNPELLTAKKLGIPVYSFPQYVYEVCKDKKRIVVAGSHGKTTITSMIMHILKHQGLDFDYLVGARVAGFDESVKLSDAPLIVIEGDEYPASVEEKRPKIFFYHPHISVLSGIAWDHINVFPTYQIYVNQFEQYLDGISDKAIIIYNNEDEEVNNVVHHVAERLTTIPYHTPDFHYEDGCPVIDTEHGSFRFSVFGRHNMLNMEAAIAVCKQLGISTEQCYKAMETFTGAARRLEKIKEEKDLLVYRDFAHAPSKLKATLDAVREAYPHHRLIACFELHTYSSLSEHFMEEYAHTMDAADAAIVYFSHHALSLKGLPPLETSVVKGYFKRKDLNVIENGQELHAEIHRLLSEKHQPVFLLMMSSGTFDGIDLNALSSQNN